MGNVQDTEKVVELLMSKDKSNYELGMQLQKNVDLDIKTLAACQLKNKVRFECVIDGKRKYYLRDCFMPQTRSFTFTVELIVGKLLRFI